MSVLESAIDIKSEAFARNRARMLKLDPRDARRVRAPTLSLALAPGVEETKFGVFRM